MELSSDLVNQIFLIASIFWVAEKICELAESIIRWAGDWLISILGRKERQKGDSDE